MIRIADRVFTLDTPDTTYMFRVLPEGHLEHLYYGASLGDPAEKTDEEIQEDAEALGEKREFPQGNAISWDEEHQSLCMEDLRSEISTTGKGDLRDTMISLIHADGGRTSDFLYESSEIREGKEPLETLPSSYADPADGKAEHAETALTNASAVSADASDGKEEPTETALTDASPVSANPAHGKVEQLVVTLREASGDCRLELHYYVFEDCDVITRTVKLINCGSGKIQIRRLLSAQLDFETAGYKMSVFTGAWAREMQRHELDISGGRVVSSTTAGISSNACNPFVMLYPEGTSETAGGCYGINLIYSGNHYESAEVSRFGKTRFLTGINPEGFSWQLLPGEIFEAPEAVMTWSGSGFTGMSLHMHHFVREHIVRGEWKHKARPVLLNSWEAAYFKFDEKKLLRLAKAGKDAGIELFVMDDGWFGTRDDDTQALGDWTVNKKKLPDGLKGLADKIHALGMDFGLWVEPEMISANSDLYRAHPDWAMQIPGRQHAEGRHQMLLDLANPEVVDYMIGCMSDVFSSADINYVKWDMNRVMSDVYSPWLASQRDDAECQGETAHRYILGYYRMLKTLTEKFPHILFEGCASGGCRFDLGVLCCCPQIWASDDTDPVERSTIQEGYSYGYPMSVVSAHVSASPNHQTLRETPLDTRFNVAVFGVFGCEMNLCDMDHREFQELKEKILLYKAWRDVLQNGDFYRGRTGRIHEWTCVAPDRKKAVGMILQEKAVPNAPFEQFRARGLDGGLRYHFYSLEQKRDIRSFGDLVNTASPVHVKPGSFLHRLIADFVTMPGEQEEVRASGRLLMDAGVKLAPGYAGTGYNENTRYFADGCSRMYFMEAD